ncbi:hypothetical protein SCUP515_14003 [Seiridium cupressi]
MQSIRKSMTAVMASYALAAPHVSVVRDNVLTRDQSGALLCSIDTFSPADRLCTMQNINTLRDKHTTCPADPFNLDDPDHRPCERVACQWNSAVYVCNDNYYKVSPACDLVADYAQAIVDACTSGQPNWKQGQTVQGQLFDTDNWNIVVAAGDC